IDDLHPQPSNESATAWLKAVALLVPQYPRLHLAHIGHGDCDGLALVLDRNVRGLGGQPFADERTEGRHSPALLALEDRLQLSPLVGARALVEVEARRSVAVKQGRPWEIDPEDHRAAAQVHTVGVA